MNLRYIPTGKTDGQPELGLGGNVVKKLTRNITGHNYAVYCDNFFTSAALFQDLLADSIYACGTYTIRKCYPSDLKDKSKKGLGTRGLRVQTRWTIASNIVAGYENSFSPFHSLST